MAEQVKIIYDHEKTVTTEAGTTILKTSLANGIPHMHVCGGHARCSTCRVIVLEGAENLSPPNEKEIALATKKNFPPGVRLACQTKVMGDVKLRRLVMDDTDANLVIGSSGPGGREEQLAILFSDVRNFTPFSERQLPYDIIHILNRYFKEMGQAILDNNGFIDKYMGDGMMAIFGLQGEPNAQKCANAARAALSMTEKLAEVNQYLQKHFNEQFKIGIGLHFSSVIVGEVGHPQRHGFTALGDGVNIASRIESTTKRANATILASEAFIQEVRSLNTIQTGRVFLAKLKGKSEKQKLFEITNCLTENETATSRIRHFIREKLPLNLAPRILRLAFHEVMSYKGMSAILNDDESMADLLSEELHKNMAPAFSFISETYESLKQESYSNISVNELIYLAGAVAVEITGGPYISIELPIPNTSIETNQIESREPKLPGIPTENESFNDIYIRFKKANLDRKDMVALMGAHTLGQAHGRYFTENPYRFDNEFFKRLLRDDLSMTYAVLASDREVLKDSKSAQYIEQYADDQEVFFNDFRAAYLKMIQI
ncbi:MAG: 2Fe-2S iron-sulfur cluster binding domain-containing protein [Leptonema sp. (in: Bacteria)]|nr:2Fe-2S iron-sulfur cluster binding domain-containing protein [Leptonema sp. (in: bacteria)]